MDETYLGDGLYVSFDGFQLTLRAPRHDGDHCVYLEPATYEALTNYVRGLKADLEKRVKAQTAAKEAPHA